MQPNGSILARATEKVSVLSQRYRNPACTNCHLHDISRRIPMLNYRTFRARVVLKSFGNRLIDKFDSGTLLNGLHMEAEERDLIPCGTSLCFKRGVNVKGSHCK